MERKIFEIIENALVNRDYTILNDDEDCFLIRCPNNGIRYQVKIAESDD